MPPTKKPTKKPTKRPKKKAKYPVKRAPQVTRSKSTRKTSKRATDGRRWWSDQERFVILAALKANGGNVALTAVEQNVPYQTLWAWSRNRRCPEALQLQTEYDAKLEIALTEIAWQAAALMPMKMDKAPLNHLTHLLATVIEKARLLRGETTSFEEKKVAQTELSIDFARLSPDERQAFLALYGKLRGTAPTGTGGSSEGGRVIQALPMSRPVPAVLG